MILEQNFEKGGSKRRSLWVKDPNYLIKKYINIENKDSEGKKYIYRQKRSNLSRITKIYLRIQSSTGFCTNFTQYIGRYKYI